MKNSVKFFALIVSIFGACTANAGEPVQRPASNWAEVPNMAPSGRVLRVTHWVDDSGEVEVLPDMVPSGRVRNYTVAFDTALRQPLWVAYPMHRWYDGDAGRSDRWHADNLTPADEQPLLKTSYNAVADNGAFSRGHLLASDCRQRSRAMNNQTFHYTNSAPQTQNAFNGGIWLKLENLERGWGFRPDADTLYVVTGSVFASDNGDQNPGGGQVFDGGSGGARVTSDNAGNVIPVPTHFYKALLTTKGSGVGKPVGECAADELMCVVFFLDHFGHANNARPTAEQMMSVDELEQITGFDFFPTLTPGAESMESSFDPCEWGL
jgi:endonuclease G